MNYMPSVLPHKECLQERNCSYVCKPGSYLLHMVSNFYRDLKTADLKTTQHRIYRYLGRTNIIISSLASGSSLAISLISKALYSMCLFAAPGRWLAARTVYVRVSVNGS